MTEINTWRELRDIDDREWNTRMEPTEYMQKEIDELRTRVQELEADCSLSTASRQEYQLAYVVATQRVAELEESLNEDLNLRMTALVRVAELEAAGKLALGALTESVDLVQNQYLEYADLYSGYPTRTARVDSYKRDAELHVDAIEALKKAGIK